MSTKVIYQDVRKVYVETDDAGLVRAVIEQKHGIEEINAREDTLTFTADLTIRDMLSDEMQEEADPMDKYLSRAARPEGV